MGTNYSSTTSSSAKRRFCYPASNFLGLEIGNFRQTFSTHIFFLMLSIKDRITQEAKVTYSSPTQAPVSSPGRLASCTRSSQTVSWLWTGRRRLTATTPLHTPCTGSGWATTRSRTTIIPCSWITWVCNKRRFYSDLTPVFLGAVALISFGQSHPAILNNRITWLAEGDLIQAVNQPAPRKPGVRYSKGFGKFMF